MKKILCFSIALMMTLTLMVGCGEKSSSDDPSSAVKATLSAIKNYDTDKITKSITGSTEMFNESEDAEIITPLLSDMKFKITDTEVDGDKAVATVEMEIVDFTEYFGFMLQEAITLSVSGLNEKEQTKKMMKNLKAAIKDDKLTSNKTTVKINCEKVDEEWKVVADETLTEAIFGADLAELGNFFNMD